MLKTSSSGTGIDQSAKRNVPSTQQNVLKTNNRWHWKCVGAIPDVGQCHSSANLHLCILLHDSYKNMISHNARSSTGIDQSAKRNVPSTQQNVLEMNSRWH
jgi:hypothetical protein